MNNIKYIRKEDHVEFKNNEFKKLVEYILNFKLENKELKDNNRIYKRLIIVFIILILVLLFSLLKTSYESGVKSCIISGNSEKICREGLR